MRLPANQSVSMQRRLAITLTGLVMTVLAVGLSGVFVLDRATADIQRLTLGLTPAHDANDRVRISLMSVGTQVRVWSLRGDQASAASAVSACSTAQGDAAAITATFAASGLNELVDRQQARIDDYCRQLPDLLTQPSAQVPVPNAAMDANAQVRGWFDTERETARAEMRTLHRNGLIALVLLCAASTTLAAVAAQRTHVWLAQPLHRLARVIARLRSGDEQARAIPEGAAEVRALAEALNGLSDEAQHLRAEQRLRLELRQRTQEAAARIRAELDHDEVLTTAAWALGTVLDLDRAVIRDLSPDGDGRVLAQWQGPGLTPVTDPWLLDPCPDEPMLTSRRWHEMVDQPTSLADVQSSDFAASAGGQRVIEATDATALVQVAVGSDTLLAGVWLASTRGYRGLTQDELATLALITRELGQALTQSRLFATQTRLVDELQDLDRQKSDFVSTVSHELRTPLASVRGYTELMLDGDAGPLTQTQRSMIEVIERNGNRLSALIEDLLTLSRIEAGAAGTGTRPVAVGPVIEAVLATLAPQINDGGLDVSCHPGVRAATVLADPRQLERALLNVLSNAVKFTPAGGQVSIGCAVQDDDVVLTVRDTGIGIPHVEHDQLFGRFFRASNAVDGAIPGTGLGLTIVRDIVEGFGGSVSLQSVVGQGTTIALRLRAVVELPSPSGSFS